MSSVTIARAEVEAPAGGTNSIISGPVTARLPFVGTPLPS